MKSAEELEDLLDTFKPFNEFKDKVKNLGREIIKIEDTKTDPGYRLNFHSEHYRRALLDLFTESMIEQIKIVLMVL